LIVSNSKKKIVCLLYFLLFISDHEVYIGICPKKRDKRNCMGSIRGGLISLPKQRTRPLRLTLYSGRGASSHTSLPKEQAKVLIKSPIIGLPVRGTVFKFCPLEPEILGLLHAFGD
jgi:hypothetical protein